jgi:CO/xanthine dehydrogenase Mo-binding subunit
MRAASWSARQCTASIAGNGRKLISRWTALLLDRRAVSFPPIRNNNAMVGYNTAVGTLAELAVDATSGKVALLTHHTILECGNMLVPELVSGQLQGGVASGIGLALHEELPLYEDGPGDGTWNFNRYHLPRGSDVAVWTQTAEILPPTVQRRTAEGNGRSGDDPDHRGDRERHCGRDRPSLPNTAGDAGPDPEGFVMSLPTRPRR